MNIQKKIFYTLLFILINFIITIQTAFALPAGCYKISDVSPTDLCAVNYLSCGGKICCITANGESAELKCLKANGIACDNGYLKTAIGCLPIGSKNDFISFILKIGVGLAGGFFILMAISGGVRIIVSQGNPKKLQAGKDIITSAITGVIFIIFGIFILRFIGVDILGVIK